MFNDFAPHNLTSNTTPSPYVVSGTGTYYGQHRAFDGTEAAGFSWLGNIADLPQVTLDLGSGHSETLVAYAIRGWDDPTGSPKTWTVRGSTDNFATSNDVLDTVTAETGWLGLEKRTFVCDVAATPYRYFRLAITDNNGHAFVGFTELFLYRAPGNPDLPHGGWTAYADSSDASHLPAKAIDGSLATAWHTDTPPPFGAAVYPHEFHVDMGAAHLVNYVRFRSDADFAGGLAHEVEVYLSDNGTAW